MARFLVGDVFERLATIPDGSVDLVLTSPPFLALRSYLPDGHPDKAMEIGSEATPAEFLDTLLALTAEWGRVLAPHGSIAVELGDTYSGSGGAGGDYSPGGLRDGQQAFDGTAAKARRRPGDYPVRDDYPRPARDRVRNTPTGWPLEKSLCGIPTLYAWSLAYGRNLLTGAESPAGMWRVRTLKPWIRSNPPVGALGDKERPATSYVIVATRARDRYFDLDAARSPLTEPGADQRHGGRSNQRDQARAAVGLSAGNGYTSQNTAGAPPRDWWHHVDAVLDACLDDMARTTKTGPTTVSVAGASRGISGGDSGNAGKPRDPGSVTQGARGVHLRRALERAGILSTLEAVDVSPKGYSGAHYAVWPPELVRLLVDEMCPRKVCTTCGQPSRRITVDRSAFDRQPELAAHIRERREALGITSAEVNEWFGYKEIAKNWERTDRHGAAIPNADDWPVLAERLGLDRDRFDDLVLGPRRWAESTTEHVQQGTNGRKSANHVEGPSYTHRALSVRSDLGWSDCGHGAWRPGLVLDPFVGSGTTLAVCSGMARDSIGIDIDDRNADLARQRVGLFLEVGS